jgi:tellurite resistance protein TerC
MLGLRSLYFVLADALHRMRYIRHGLALLLAFTGVKMLAGDWIHIGPGASVLVIALVLLTTTAASVLAGNETAAT